MPPEPINLAKKLALFSDTWAPRVIAEMNDYQIKLFHAEGAFTWHSHADTDEVFIVIEGELDIHLREGVVTLGPGELLVIPRGVEHKPVARETASVMLFEPVGVVNTGDASGELTAENDVWV